MAATYEPIATTTLGSAASSITFSSIPATYTDLRLVFTGTGSSNLSSILFRLNSDTAANYSFTYIAGSGTAAASARGTSTTSFFWDYTGISTTIPHFYTVDLFSYAGSTYKTVLATTQEDNNGSGSITNAVGLWRSTAAINTIAIIPQAGNLNAGSTATLWGIKAA